jgi:EmrB/QacA subfamily drug resistance transporter
MVTSRKWWALGALVVCLLTLGLDGTILNVALPTLATQLHASTGGLQWIVDAYILVFAGLLLPMGALGDRVGRKRLLLFGLGFFLVASVAAAYVSDVGALIAARAVMGLGSAILTPVAMGVLPVIFEPRERARAIAIAATAMGLGVPLGPIVGGWLLDHFWWGSVFLVNVPVAVVGMIAVAFLVPESRDTRARPADLVGGGLSTAALVAFVYGVIEAPRQGWTDPRVLATVVAGLLLGAGFVVWERRSPAPMINLALFGRPRFLWGTVAATIGTFALFGLLFTVPQYLQAVLGHDAFATGIRLLPLMGGLILAAAFSDRISGALGAKVPVALGLMIIGGGLALGASTGPGDGYGLLATWLAIVGFGTGLCLAPAMDAVLGELPVAESGSGTALTMTLRQVGGALGVAALGSLLASGYTDRLDVSGLPASAAGAARDSVSAAVAVAGQLGDRALAENAQAAYVHGMDLVLIVCAVIAVAGAVLVALALPARAATVAVGPSPADDAVGSARAPVDGAAIPARERESEHDSSRAA